MKQLTQVVIELQAIEDIAYLANYNGHLTEADYQITMKKLKLVTGLFEIIRNRSKLEE